MVKKRQILTRGMLKIFLEVRFNLTTEEKERVQQVEVQ